MFLLEVHDYSVFSLVYLVFAQGWSIALSGVCDTWARLRTAGMTAGSWANYTGALAAISGTSAVVTLLVGLLMFHSVVEASAMAVGVGASLYRQAARYYQAGVRGPHAVLLSDGIAVVGFLGALVVLHVADQAMLTALLLAWALSGLASAAFYLPGAFRDGGPTAWYRRNRTTVRSLLGESLLMDAGAVATPMLVAPTLGLHNFGIYRSVSSLSVPIQLLIDPIRPNLSQLPLRRAVSTQAVATAVTLSASVGAAAHAALTYLVPIALPFSPVLTELRHFALPCGVFVTFQVMTYILNILARIHVSHRRLIIGRATHTVFAILLPVVGALLAGLPGAVWCFVATSASTVVIWLLLLILSARRGVRPAHSGPSLP
ncbi:hypothetical protein [Geodermatophilus obscurus]|uniref:hypothetical protein n=1 Tax=Geodermatophilus obscurus TaxID=1861 RepID=UPI001FCC4AE8|nr:hypothetical protein [Geodermatophilus obscurus]